MAKNGQAQDGHAGRGNGGGAGTVFYVLVNSSTEGMALYAYLRSVGCMVRIAPAPHEETVCCGMALMVETADMPAVRTALANGAAPAFDRVIERARDINPNRDVYC